MLQNSRYTKTEGIKVKPILERQVSGEQASAKYQGDPKIIAWKKAPFIRSVTVTDKRDKMQNVLGLIDMSSYQRLDGDKIINSQQQ